MRHQMATSRCGRGLSRDDEVKLCPVVAASKLLRSIWSLIVISYLQSGPQSFNELLRAIPGINSKTLSRTLKSLQKAGLVNREVVSTQPFAVRYSLTEMAADLGPLLRYLRDWGERWLISPGESSKGSLPSMGRGSRQFVKASNFEPR